MKQAGCSVAIELAGVSALCADMPPRLDDWLNDGEQQRLAAITSVLRRRQFLAGHWLLRRQAAGIVGGEPAQWSLTAGADHAPSLQSLRQNADERYAASLSHSGEWVVAAIAAFPIGIDLECPMKPRNLLALADAVFSPEERARLRELPADRRATAFYLHWTVKEAVGKREGHGLRPELARRQRPMACPADEAEVVSWQFADCSLALAGAIGMSVRVAGLPENANPGYWRIEPATY